MKNNQILKESMEYCMVLPFSQIVCDSIKDLELLIERHTQDRYFEIEYLSLFTNKKFYDVVLEADEANHIVYFLFFLLLNFPDRSPLTAHAVTKCYNFHILVAVSQGIELYMNKNDITTINLIKHITNSYYLNLLDKNIINIFNNVIKNGMPESKAFLIEEFQFFKDKYNFDAYNV